MENDENIRVNILTGTSTRAPRPRNAEIPRQEHNLPFEGEITIEWNTLPIPNNSYQGLLSLMHMANRSVHTEDLVYDIMSRSMYDSQLHRNPSIRLNINTRNCKTSEIDDDCSICQGKFKIGDKLSTLQECNHSFHTNCLQEWGKYKQECPLCRSAIPILER